MHELGTFVITYPCWAILHKDSMEYDESGKPIAYKREMSFMVIDDDSGDTWFPIFTDGDLASRFLKCSDLKHDMRIIDIPDSEYLVKALRMAQQQAQAMTVDQPEPLAKPYAIWPLEYAIAKVEAGELL